MPRPVLPCIAVIVVIIFAPASAAGVKVVKPATEATLNLIEGTAIKLSDLRGEVVVLNY